MLHPIQDDPSLIRLELLGNLARAARLALQECEQADAVEFNINASTDSMTVDVVLMVNGQPFTGWGQ